LEPTQSQARNDDAKSKDVPGASKSAGHAIGKSDDISGGDGSEDDDGSGDDDSGGDRSRDDDPGDEPVGRANATKHETQWEVEAVLDRRVDSETGLGQYLSTPGSQEATCGMQGPKSWSFGRSEDSLLGSRADLLISTATPKYTPSFCLHVPVLLR